MSAGLSPCAGCGQEAPGCWVCRPGLVEVLRSAPDPGGWRAGMDAEDYAHLADVVLAWVAAGLDGAREGVARDLASQMVLYTLPANYGRPLGDQTHEDVALRCADSHADAALAVVREALDVPSGLRGFPVSDEERSVGFGDGSDDEGGL